MAAQPRPIRTASAVGHGLAIAIGLANLSGGIAAFASGQPAVLALTLLIAGLLIPVLVLQSLAHSRPAWAFLIALVAVFGGTTLFGAPKISHLLGIGLGYALLIPAVKTACVISLAMVRDEYQG